MWGDPSVSIRDSELKVQRVFASEEAYLFILASPCLKEFPHAWRIQVSGADPSFQRRASGDAEDVVSSLMFSATPHSQHHLLVLRFCTRDTLRLRIDYWTDKRGYWFAVAFLCVHIGYACSRFPSPNYNGSRLYLGQRVWYDCMHQH